MPRKKDASVVIVLDYFESAPLDAAKLALQLAARAIKKRDTTPAGPAKTKKRESASTAPTAGAPASGPSTGASATPPAAPGSEAKAPRATRQAPPAGAPPAQAAPPAAADGGVPAV